MVPILADPGIQLTRVKLSAFEIKLENPFETSEVGALYRGFAFLHRSVVDFVL